MKDIAIKVDHVSKDFLLPHQRAQSVKSVFTGLLRPKNRTIETQHALRDVSFEVKKGEFFGIVGRNGSGKSTLLKMLAGIYNPTKGTVATHGKLVPFIELGVGFNPELTGRENVYLNGALLGFSAREIDKQYNDIVRFAELEEFMDQKLKNYSSGMQVRLAFSVATTARADILLIDEVLAVGDADFQRKCFDYFKQLKKSGVTVVFVSHDMNAVREYCDRALLVDESKIVAEGNPEDIARDYTRLFAAEAAEPNTKEAKSAKRWGDNAITFSKVTLSERKLDDATPSLTITAHAVMHKLMERPVFGFLVRGPDGRQILGTNTYILQKKIGTYQAGTTLRVTWTVPNVFSEGVHSVDVTATHKEFSNICDWWEDATRFRVVKEKRTPYPVTPDMQVELQ